VETLKIGGNMKKIAGNIKKIGGNIKNWWKH